MRETQKKNLTKRFKVLFSLEKRKPWLENDFYYNSIFCNKLHNLLTDVGPSVPSLFQTATDAKIVVADNCFFLGAALFSKLLYSEASFYRWLDEKHMSHCCAKSIKCKVAEKERIDKSQTRLMLTLDRRHRSVCAFERQRRMRTGTAKGAELIWLPSAYTWQQTRSIKTAKTNILSHRDPVDIKSSSRQMKMTSNFCGGRKSKVYI